MPNKKKFPYFATFFTAAGFCVLCALGVWQLQRLTWKTNLVNQLNAEYAKDATQAFLSPADTRGDFMFRRGTLRGVYEYERQIKIGPRVYEKFPGYHVLTPLRLEDGSHILVNRGWVPQDWAFKMESIPMPGQDVAVTGLLRNPEAPNSFTPENRPDRDEWFSADIPQIAGAKKISGLGPYLLYLEGRDVSGTFPIPQSSKPDLPNNHLQYAVFWFTMAGILLTIYAIRFFRKTS